jgi:sugar O-acyltransferase, sialic acid O-acetyltransferase NeuD family
MKGVIIGAGKYGEVYLSYLQEAGYEIIGFLDDSPSEQGAFHLGIPVLGPISILTNLKSTHSIECVFCPLGNNKLRAKLLKRAKDLGYKTPGYIHPTARISPNVQIGEGVYILMDTNVMPHVIIHNYVMISTGANIIHHTTLMEGVFVSNGVNLGASINVKPFAYCGMGSTIMTGVEELGEDCLIGAGAVVIKDVPDHAVVAGVPAKIIRIKTT